MIIADVDTSLIDTDPENPNRMTEAKYTALVAAIRLVGFNQNAIVEGPLPTGRYLMRDGNHRLRAARELGLTTIPCVVAPPDSKLGLAGGLIFNNIRGQIDETSAADVLDNLVAAGWSMEELHVTGFTDQEIGDLVRAARETSPDDALGSAPGEAVDLEDLDPPIPGAPRPFLLEVDFADRKTYVACRRALKRAAGKGEPLSAGLVKVLGLEPGS